MAGTTTFYGISYPTSTDYVKDGASAIQTVATGFDSAVAIPTYNAQTGATYTFVLADTGKTVTASNASAQTYTIPPTASVAWTANTTLRVLNLGAGVVTFAAGAGVTVTNTAQTLAQYQSAKLVRTGLNAWTVTPDSGLIPGMTLIKTQTIGSAVSSVTITDAFNATYENYKIIITGGVSSADTQITGKLGASATGYHLSQVYVTYGSSSPAASSNNNTANWNSVAACTADNIRANIEIFGPFLATFTHFNSIVWASAASLTSAGTHKVATSFTDFTLAPLTGTLTGGTIYVYGFNK